MRITELIEPLVLKEADMLDISITNADKVVQDDPAKIQMFLSQHFTVTQKVDGTKLSLYRNAEPFNANDYTKNWVVAYKNRIMYPEDFEGIDREQIKTQSIGISQYGLVHDHLRGIQSQLRTIPKNTEFFIEFIQNKPTTTRNYEKFHALILLAYSPAAAKISGGMLRTQPQGFFQ